MNDPTCAICGLATDGADHVKVDVEHVPPEEPPKTYYFHKRCFDRSQAWQQDLR